MIKLHIISSDINSGKTLYINNLAGELISNAYNVGGLISLKNDRGGYDAQLFHNTENIIINDYIQRLAWSDEILKNFSFNEQVFEKVYELSLKTRDVFIIDEVGQLEIIYKRGFHNVLEYLLDGEKHRLKSVIVSVKSKMLSQFFFEYKLIDRFNEGKLREISLRRVHKSIL